MTNIIKRLISIYHFTDTKINLFYNSKQFSFNNTLICAGWKVYGKIFIRNLGYLKIGKNFFAISSRRGNPIGGDTILRLIVNKSGILNIGNNVGISNSTIVCWENIQIGDHVKIGGSCKIWDTDFHSLDAIERCINGDKQINTAPIIIKDYAFIGGNSIILKGVSIGKRSIIGGGSVVTNNVPDNEIWAGNPAKFIRTI